MGLTHREVNTIKDLQVKLKELGLYMGVIDGVWGRGSANAATTLFKEYDYILNGVKYELKSISGDTQGLDSKRVYVRMVEEVQSTLKKLGCYNGIVDGIWGNLSEAGFNRVCRDYRAHKKTPFYGIAFSNNPNVNKEFTDLVEDYCERMDFFEGSANALMACMHFESGGTYSPSIQNTGGSNYFGLIQFGKAAASDLGFSLEQIKKMGQLEQLEKAVFPYFDMWAKRGKKATQLEDFYLTILYPAAVGKKSHEALFIYPSVVYRQNSGLDRNRDGKIIIGEISQVIYDTYYNGMDIKNRIITRKQY